VTESERESGEDAEAPPDAEDWVGPVLSSGASADAVREAIVSTQPGVRVVDRGAYIRVLSRGTCRLDPQVVEELSGEPFRLPGDLERIMPAFLGTLSFAGGLATWTHRGRRR
jgi:hypothetical protein